MQPFIQITLSQTNCYLLKARQGYLMVDCGREGDKRRLLRKLRLLEIPVTSIRWLLLTHHHSDHCGLLHYLISVNPDIRVIMSRTCADYLETGSHFHPATEMYANTALQKAFSLFDLMGGYLSDTFIPYLRREGDFILYDENAALPDPVGISGSLLHTPGHTEDSISLITDGDAFVGDAARNMLNFLGSPYEPILMYNRTFCIKSWSKLLSIGVERIHPAHGQCFEIKHLQNKLIRCHQFG
ncbi:MAG: MBL fold metallo-hydrolase [Clostridiaceae bacterium]